MPLTDTAIRTAKPGTKPVRMFDGGGLYLELSPAGGKLWRFKYRFNGKEKRLALGIYPDIGLKDARERREEARKLLANGADPGETRKAQKAAKVERSANSFEVIAREWFAKHRDTWAASHADKIIARLENDVFPWLGGKAIAEITAPNVLEVLRRIEKRGTLDTAHRAKGNISQVMRYAIATGRAERDPCPDLRGALPPVKESNFASITEPAKVAELLRAIDGFSGTFVVQCTLRLAPLLFVRPGELRRAEWTSFDLDRAEWGYFVTKTKSDHLVPLASQAVVILRELHALTGHGRFVFPGARGNDRSMSDGTINAALQRLGYDTKEEITGHGFRAMARTILHEELHQKPEVIEHQLAHTVSDALGTAYNRTKFLKERKAMMQLWADYLDKLKAGAEVIPLHGSAA
ncbi:tyrosine-type recombinase/integrase [Dechloromonas sp. A34]|uniref:tyrosine-type recombinase/integrase n=1 Tax=Dechloromonas sp. A34 TaxID=447588 RepID=UPI002249445C|nr:integrase arm-type DNA-binding domain-containing protein [Dechloromonas sp. A34]